jgi:subtilase family serine protease
LAASSSGGISTYYPIPDWQTNVSMTENRGSTIMRNTPDVAANADNVYAYTDEGQAQTGWGGTSCSAPLWAGLTALMNQQAAASKLPRVGFLNPALYAIASRSDYSRFFHDITKGNNTWRGSPNLFYATAGYDLCCGLGSIGTNLINAIVFPAVTLLPIGNLKVIIGPAGAIAAGAKWQVDGGNFMASGTTFSNISAGNHTVSFSALSEWIAPAAQTINVISNTTTTASGTYVVAGSLKVTITPALAVKDGAQWSVDGGALQNGGATVNDITVGDHVLGFSAVSGWSAPSAKMTPGSVPSTQMKVSAASARAKPIGSPPNSVMKKPASISVPDDGTESGATKSHAR